MSIFFDNDEFDFMLSEAPSDDMGSSNANTTFDPDTETPTEGDGTAGSDPAGDAAEDMGDPDANTEFNPDEDDAGGDDDGGTDDDGDDAGMDDGAGGDEGGMDDSGGSSDQQIANNDEEVYKKEKLLGYCRNLMNQMEDIIQSVKLISYNTLNTDHKMIKIIQKNLEIDYKNLVELIVNRFNKYSYEKILTIYTYIKINVSNYIDLIKKFMDSTD